MTPDQVTRLLDFAKGYWPNAKFPRQVELAWTRALAKHDPSAARQAVEDYATEGHPFPPIVGQIVARIPTEKPESETERIRRQRADASRKVKAGKMKQADYDFYEDDYWGKIDGPDGRLAA